MKKEQTSYSFSSREQSGYQAKENVYQTFKPQNYAGGFLKPSFNAVKGLIYMLCYSLGKLMPSGKANTPVTVFQILILILGIWTIFRLDLKDNGGFTTEVSKAGFLQISDQNKDMEFIENHSKSNIEFNEADVKGFVNRFAKVAIAENKKFNIPASVLLSVALLESEAGKEEKVKTTNNFFGHKMGEKHFATAWENWRAHSLYLVHEAKGEGLLDREEWIYFIAKGEIGNSNLYAWQLKTLIETYDLQTFDEK